MVEDLVETWPPIDSGERKRTRIALAITFSMPVGTDPIINETAVLAVARKAFVGHDQVWVAGIHEGPFVKMLVEYRNEEGRAVPAGPADLSRYRARYARELSTRGIPAQATSRMDRGLEVSESRPAYKARMRKVT